MKDKTTYYRLRKEMEKNYNEIGKICTELQYYEIVNNKHLKVSYLQYRLKKVLLINYKLLVKAKEIENEKGQ